MHVPVQVFPCKMGLPAVGLQFHAPLAGAVGAALHAGTHVAEGAPQVLEAVHVDVIVVPVDGQKPVVQVVAQVPPIDVTAAQDVKALVLPSGVAGELVQAMHVPVGVLQVLVAVYGRRQQAHSRYSRQQQDSGGS